MIKLENAASGEDFRHFSPTSAAKASRADDPRFATNPDRMAHREELTAMIETTLAKDTHERWRAGMHTTGVPARDVRTVEDAFNSVETAERVLASSIPHRPAGEFPNVGSPLHFRDTPVCPDSGPDSQPAHQRSAAARPRLRAGAWQS
ncbi:CoA transferase [Rhodopseudomonas palustris]|uniref:CoA transferase n=1 Tax=Rhodopseudomonas palustris TaxID=1076 RepID=UPI002ACEC73D|nr:CoA transferase [Rhodopseudomonas palustris]WQH00510.1 CoA transferase [Rhodopseudomonas palustris]